MTMVGYTRDESPSLWERWTGWRLRGRGIDGDRAVGRWGTGRSRDGVVHDGEKCSVSVVHNCRCTIEPSEQAGGRPVRRCERTKQVFRHCLGQPPEVIESSSDVEVTEILEAVGASSVPVPVPAPGADTDLGAGLSGSSRGGRPLDGDWFGLFGHDGGDAGGVVGEFPHSRVSPFRVWWFGWPDGSGESMRKEQFDDASTMEEALPRTEEMFRQYGVWPGKGGEYAFGRGRGAEGGGCAGAEQMPGEDGKSGRRSGGKQSGYSDFQRDFHEV